jgi:hypothetical protein
MKGQRDLYVSVSCWKRAHLLLTVVVCDARFVRPARQTK